MFLWTSKWAFSGGGGAFSTMVGCAKTVPISVNGAFPPLNGPPFSLLNGPFPRMHGPFSLLKIRWKTALS